MEPLEVLKIFKSILKDFRKYDFKKMNLLLKNEKLINSIKIGWGQMSLFNFRSFYDLFNLHIKRNPFFVIKKKYFAK